MSRPRDLSSASSAPRCTSAADKVAVAVVVANGGTSWVYPRGVFPAQSAPRAGGRDWLYPPSPPLSCSSVPPVADAQGDSYTSSLATPELRRNGRLAADRRDSGKMAQCRKATFPPKLAKVFLSELESLLEDSFTRQSNQVPLPTIAPHSC